MTKVSLYIPCYNVGEFIESCIQAVLQQTHPVAEILLIDDGCVDRTIEIAQKYPVKIIKHPVNKGLAAARNTAFKNAQHELVASLDADCVADPLWLETLLSHLEDPQVAIVGGKLVESVLDSQADRWRESHMTQNWGERILKNPLFMFGNNNVIRKSVIEQIGYYNESMRTNGEDSDISKRIRAAGFDAVYDHNALVKHRRYDSLASILDTYWRHWRFGSRSYFGEPSPKEVLRNAYHHLLSRTPALLGKDWRDRRYELLALDLLVPGYMIYRDLRTFQGQKIQSPEIAGSASA
ncbi:MAG: glycosyltransferase [Cyanobacteria bacterium J06635_13]